MKAGDQPAFPRPGFTAPDGVFGGYDCEPHPGMTLRQWYAGLAMQAIIGKMDLMLDVRGEISASVAAGVADGALKYADALIAAGEERP